jgi:hypothetical protein
MTARKPFSTGLQFRQSPPLGARKDARHLLAEWQRRGAKSARVLNVRAEAIYEIGE